MRSLRDSTIYQRRRTIIRLQKWLGSTPLLEATHRDLAGYIARDVQPESRACDASHIRQFYEWCIDEELITVSPARRIRRPKTPRRSPRPISEDDLFMALEMAPTHIRTWLLLAAFAGLRCCEIAPLRGEDIAWTSTPPRLHVTGKGGHRDQAAMPPYLSRELKRCGVPLSGWLCPRLDGRPGHLQPYSVSRHGADFFRSIEVPCTMHQLRHRYATQLLRVSGSIRLTQVGMRHATITSTQLYTEVLLAEVHAAATKLPTPAERARLAAVPDPDRIRHLRNNLGQELVAFQRSDTG